MEGSIVANISGSFSAASSALIVYIILRSRRKLSSIYHRIMFGMSVAGIMGSVSMALATLPMPSHMPREEEFDLSWSGPRLGNTHTCNAQGFFFMFGVCTMFCYNSALCSYYCAAIAFRIKEKNIRKYIEPWLHGFSIGVPLVFAIAPLAGNLYNPSSFEDVPWCLISVYPVDCDYRSDGIAETDVECIRGGGKLFMLVPRIIMVTTFMTLTSVILCLSIVLWRVIKTDRAITAICNTLPRRTRNHRDNHQARENVAEDVPNIARKQNHNSKVVLIQAMAYVFSLVFTLTFPTLNALKDLNPQSSFAQGVGRMSDTLETSFLPLQGVFNFIIFLGHKIYNRRRDWAHEDESICQIIRQLFAGSVEEPVFISRITLVYQHEEQQQRNNRKMPQYLRVEDELDGCVSYAISSTGSGSDDAEAKAEAETDEGRSDHLFVDSTMLSVISRDGGNTVNRLSAVDEAFTDNDESVLSSDPSSSSSPSKSSVSGISFASTVDKN